MDFFCVYVKNRKKLDKYVKVNRIRNKYIIDIKKIIEEEDISFDNERTYLKIIIFQKIQQAIDKNKDRYCHLALDGTEKDIKSSLSPSFFKKVPTGSSLYFRIIIGPHDDCREFDQSMLNDMAGSIEDMCGFEESMAIQRDSRNQKTQGNESVITEIELIFKF